MTKIEAPIDNKNLCEDPFEDEVFSGFDEARDHRKKSLRHLMGYKEVTEDGWKYGRGLVDVQWKWGENVVRITLLAISGCADTSDWDEYRKDIFNSYRREFKAWECEDNPGLVVEFYELVDTLTVLFYFETE